MRKILITGSSTGIGKFITTRLVQEGDHVWGISRSDQSSLKEVFQSKPEKFSGQFQFSQCDVSCWESVEMISKKLESQWGNLDAIICATGVQGNIGPAMSCDPYEWQKTVNMNLNGIFFTLRAFYPSLLKTSQKRGKVLCFSGGGATSSRPNFSAYAVAKTAIVRLVEILADEWANEKIDINSIAPGAIYTRMTEEVLALGPQVVGQKEYEIAQKLKVTGGASLDKVYGLIDFLLSERGNGISGKLLSAPWDSLEEISKRKEELSRTEVFTLRRILLDELK